MVLSVEQLHEVAGIVAASPDVRTAAATLRQRFASMRTLVLDAFEMRGERPAVQLPRRAIYLMSTDGHCWTVTAEPGRASALVLTES